MNIFFAPGYDYIQFFNLFDTFLNRQTNLKSKFSALSVKLCWNEEILDGTPKRKCVRSSVSFSIAV